MPSKFHFFTEPTKLASQSVNQSFTESTGEIGTGYSIDVATVWKKTFFDFKLPKTGQVAMRMAIVLGKNGGVMTMKATIYHLPALFTYITMLCEHGLIRAINLGTDPQKRAI